MSLLTLSFSQFGLAKRVLQSVCQLLVQGASDLQLLLDLIAYLESDLSQIWRLRQRKRSKHEQWKEVQTWDIIEFPDQTNYAKPCQSFDILISAVFLFNSI